VELLIVRHAIAVERGDSAYSNDDERPLTPDGIHNFRAAARGLKNLGIKPDRILTSPLVRARQTAEILRDAVASELDLDFSKHLAPGGDYGALLEEVAALQHADCVGLVGHEPHLSGFVSYCIVGEGSRSSFLLKKGAAALVLFEDRLAPGAGTLEWLLQPAGLRGMGQK
jgi:phosphohistidine phosphatase